MTPKLSIVIPTLGRSATLVRVLDGLRAQQATTDLELILVSDANGTALDTQLLGLDRGVLPVKTARAEKPGASAARNTGWRNATSSIVLFMDDDIVPSTSLTAEHLSWHMSHPDARTGVLGKVRWSSEVRISPFMKWLDAGMQFDFGEIRSVELGWQWFYTCNVSVKTDLLERSGGFDEDRFPFGYEDLELGRRLHDHYGFRLLYNHSALGEHLKTETLDSWRRNLSRIARSELQFTRMYPDVPPHFFGRFAEVAGAPPARGRSAQLARYVPRGVPWLGRYVWNSFDMVCRQRLAPEFLAAWQQAVAELEPV